jgi:oligopeptide/dipeptide ABC transporter ATP-binding protein
MTKPPYLTVRGFRVWFAKRQGFLQSLGKAGPGYVKAVDDVDLDIAKGEIFCLVGESGCGKTTLGKGILNLVDPTAGDVFVGVDESVLQEYATARAAPDSEKLEGVRERWSLSYVPKVVWKAKDVVVLALALLAGLAAASGVGALLGAALVASFGPGGLVVADVVAGMVLGFVGTLPFVKSSRRVPQVLALAFVPGFLLDLFLLLVLQGSTGGSLADAFGAAWFASFWSVIAFLGHDLIAVLVAFESARIFREFWRMRRGVEADRYRKLRKTLQIIFQDPYESLNPKQSVFDIVAEPLHSNRLVRSRAEAEDRVVKALDDAGLRPPREFLFRYPHELSGGQRQRVSIAAALVLDPDFIVADEPVSMLDVSIRTDILETLLELRQKKGLTYLFITHDLSLAWVLADRIGVMYLGKIVEQGPKKEVIRNPRHPYTKALISVVPVPDPDRRRERIILRGERPDAGDIPAGCRFHPRCPVAIETCGWTSHEVLEELQALARGLGQPERVQKATLQGPGAFTLADGAADWLRVLVAERAEEVRALKAIQDIEKTPGGVRVVLHEPQEPQLEHVSPDVQVSCHLFR